MPSLKELKNRKKSITATRKVTSAMKMIAASKLKKSQDNMIKARPYSAKIKSVIKMLVSTTENVSSDFLKKRPGTRTLYILITSDKGLCGGFNNNIIKTFSSVYNPNEDSIIAVGNKIVSYLEKNKYNVIKNYSNAFNNLNIDSAVDIGSELITMYNDNRIDKAIIIYNRFQSALSQIVVKEKILPIEFEDTDEESHKAYREFMTDPSPAELFDMIFPKYINYLIWRGLLESYASENAARLATMDSATENAMDMINAMTIQINKARQSAITQEISEIVGGSSLE